MTETAPSRRSRLTDVPSASADERDTGYGFVWRFWLVVALWMALVLEQSAALGIPLRDPDGGMFRTRLLKALVVLVVLALGEAVFRARARGWSRGTVVRSVVRVLRERWTGQRLLLVVTGLVGYFVVYLGYRNLKSWNAFNPLRDDDLLDWDQALFLGHSPAVLLHGLIGQSHAATVLHAVYTSFTYLVVLSVVGTLVFIPQVRRAYMFLAAASWAWILGTLSYYLLPSLGPFAVAPSEFAGLRPTSITESQARLLDERAHFLADPSATDAFVSIGAFGSLHVGFTCMVFFMARYYGLRRTARALGVYLVAVVLATVYFGYHYVLDDVAGVLIGALAALLGVWTVAPPLRGRRESG
jgi:membrane-associated phospholipid phosphatase